MRRNSAASALAARKTPARAARGADATRGRTVQRERDQVRQQREHGHDGQQRQLQRGHHERRDGAHPGAQTRGGGRKGCAKGVPAKSEARRRACAPKPLTPQLCCQALCWQRLRGRAGGVWVAWRAAAPPDGSRRRAAGADGCGKRLAGFRAQHPRQRARGCALPRAGVRWRSRGTEGGGGGARAPRRAAVADQGARDAARVLRPALTFACARGLRRR